MLIRNTASREGTTFTFRRLARATALASSLVLTSGAVAAPVANTDKPGLPATPT